MTRQFTATPAKRAQVNLIIGLVGPSSSGKTWTALELATGIQSVTGGDIEMIDTEHERGLFYAENFKFNHTPFAAPFASLDYLDAIKQASKRSKIIIVDSMSHEHESEGGMIDYQEAELTRITRGDDGKRQAMQMLAWAKPKAARRKLLQGMTQIDAHIILCFRAKNTSKPGKDGNGKNVVIPMGFVPIAGEEFVFESALSVLFHPNAQGIPTWNPELPGERIAVKIPRQFEWLKSQKGPLTRADGAKLAQWAAGGVQKPAQTQKPADKPTPTKPDEPALATTVSPASVWADGWDDEVRFAEDSQDLATRFNVAMKSDEMWPQLREEDPARARGIKDAVTKKVAALKEVA